MLSAIVVAGGRLVAVEDREGQVLDVEREAVADDDQQDDAAEHGQRQADRVAAQLESLALRVADHASEVEARARSGRSRLDRGRSATRAPPLGDGRLALPLAAASSR